MVFLTVASKNMSSPAVPADATDEPEGNSGASSVLNGPGSQPSVLPCACRSASPQMLLCTHALTGGLGWLSSSMSALRPRQSLRRMNSFLYSVLSLPARVRYSIARVHSPCVGRVSRAKVCKWFTSDVNSSSVRLSGQSCACSPLTWSVIV